MSHRIIYIEKCECLKLYLDNIKVIYNDNDILLPISDIQILVIDNYKSSLSIPLINKLTENNVCTVVCGIDHIPKSYILPMNGHFSQSGNINKQIEWDNNRKQIMHQKIVRAKIHNQAEILKVNNKSQDVINKLYQFENEVQIDDVTNREGLAAKMYFRELFGDDFIRFDEDVINAGLNYGYSIILSAFTREIVANGYITQLGLFHDNMFNQFNLASDLMEPFRVLIDQKVLQMKLIDFEHSEKMQLVDVLNQEVLIDGKKQYVNNAIKIYCKSVFDALNDDDSSLMRFYRIEL